VGFCVRKGENASSTIASWKIMVNNQQLKYEVIVNDANNSMFWYQTVVISWFLLDESLSL
jgi:hypothetical protein